MGFVIVICGLLVIASVCLLAWRWMEIKGQIEVARAKYTQPIQERVDALDQRIHQIEGYITGEDLKGASFPSAQAAVDFAVSALPPELQKEYRKGLPR